MTQGLLYWAPGARRRALELTFQKGTQTLNTHTQANIYHGARGADDRTSQRPSGPTPTPAGDAP